MYLYFANTVVLVAGRDFHVSETTSTAKRWAIGETNMPPEVEVGGLFTRERTISMLCSLCPTSVWEQLSSYTVWWKWHISASYIYDTFYKYLKSHPYSGVIVFNLDPVYSGVNLENSCLYLF